MLAACHVVALLLRQEANRHCCLLTAPTPYASCFFLTLMCSFMPCWLAPCSLGAAEKLCGLGCTHEHCNGTRADVTAQPHLHSCRKLHAIASASHTNLVAAASRHAQQPYMLRRYGSQAGLRARGLLLLPYAAAHQALSFLPSHVGQHFEAKRCLVHPLVEFGQCRCHGGCCRFCCC